MNFDQKWEDLHRAREWGTYPTEHLVRYVKRNFQMPFENYKALDLGCGVGAQAMMLAREGFNVAGIDASASAIQRIISRQYMDDSLHRLVVECGDICTLTYDDDLFDLVVDVCALQHVSAEDAPLAVAQAIRVLRPGGRFFSMTTKWSDTLPPDPPIRKMRLYEISKLYGDLEGINIERTEYTDRGQVIAHWLVTGQKRSGTLQDNS